MAMWRRRCCGLSGRRDVHLDALGHHRRIVRNVILVAQQKLQRVVARR